MKRILFCSAGYSKLLVALLIIFQLSISGCVPKQNKIENNLSNNVAQAGNSSISSLGNQLYSSKSGPQLVVLPGLFKTTDSNFTKKINLNNIADFAEIELEKANFKVLERGLFGSTLENITLAVNMGDIQELNKYKKGKFASTKWFLQVDVLRAEPVSQAGSGFDGKPIGDAVKSAAGNKIGGAVTGALISSVTTKDQTEIWIVGIRYKVIDASSAEIVKTGYIEEKLEFGGQSVSLLGISQSSTTLVSIDSAVHSLIRKCVSEIDRLKDSLFLSNTKDQDNKEISTLERKKQNDKNEVTSRKRDEKVITEPAVTKKDKIKVGNKKLPSKPEALTENFSGMEFVLIRGGCFLMGDASGLGAVIERPAHEVCVDDFYLGKYEVTQEEYEKVTGMNPSFFNNGPKYPVDSVSWHEAHGFVEIINSKSDMTFRLPTEAEWEYAARGYGDEILNNEKIDKIAWALLNSNGSSKQVGSKNQNDNGLFDMAGNLGEWCEDWFSAIYYKESPREYPTGPKEGTGKVVRGGGWDSNNNKIRSTYRDSFNPVNKSNNIGFRLAATIK